MTIHEDGSPSSSTALVVMVGAPGTGKSHLVREIARRVPVDIVESDAIRRSMFRRPEYTPDEHRKVFFVAHTRTEQLLRKGRSVIFDATNIHEASRRGLYEIAGRAGARVLVVRTVAPQDVVAERMHRRAAGEDPTDRSEAGWEIYLRMMSEFEAIQGPHLVVDTAKDLEPAVQEIVQFVRG